MQLCYYERYRDVKPKGTIPVSSKYAVDVHFTQRIVQSQKLTVDSYDTLFSF